MKRLLSILLSVCLLLMLFPVAFAAPAGPEEDTTPPAQEDTALPAEDVPLITDEATAPDEAIDTEDPVDIETYYEDGDTVYDLQNETDAPQIPDETPPPVVVEESDPDAAIYNDYSFDAENAAQLDNADYVMDEIIIKFKDPSEVPGKEKQLQKEIDKVEKVGFVEDLGVYVVKVADLDKNPNAILNHFKNNKYIEYAEPNYIAKAEAVPNDPNYSAMLLSLTILNAQAGWDIISGGSGPIVAVVDSGVASHPDLPPLLPGYSAVSGLSPNNDISGHGTGVAGTIGAIGNNKLGGVGINWSASILPVKVDDANNTYSAANFAKGIIWAADNGAKIISTSIGFTSDSATIKSAIDYAYSKGCAIFAAAGNDGKVGLYYPARYPNVMAVGGSANGSTRASVSSYGPGMGVLANTSYNTTSSSGGYSVMSGTSFSTPQVAGLASLVLALNPDLTNTQVYDLIEQGAKGGGVYQNDEVGYGYINIGATLQLAKDTISAPAAEAPDTTPPVITLSGSASMSINQGTAYAEPGYTANDNKDGNITSKVVVTGSVNTNTPGTYTLTYTVADAAGNSATARRIVTVVYVDRTPPVLTLNGAATMQINQGTAYTEPGYTAIDDNDGNITSKVTVTGSVNTNVAGSYTLTYRVSDAAGNIATATRTVTVIYVDTTPPVITLTGGASVQVLQGQAYVEPGYTATDNIDGNVTARVTVTGTVNTNTPGTYTLTYRVSDAAGNAATATRTVTVIYVDTTPPVITLNGATTMQINQGTAYTEPGYTATDNTDGNVTSRVAVTGTVNVNTVGSYTLTYTVSDAAGNVATATRTVQVLYVDRTPPVITLTGAAAMQIDQGTAYTEPGYTAIDSDDGNITNQVTVAGSVAINVPGAYTLTYSVSDKAGNVGSARRTVTVAAVIIVPPVTAPTIPPETPQEPPRTPPVITLTGFSSQTLDYGQPYIESGYKAVDCKGIDISSAVKVTGSADYWKAGLYTLTYDVADSAGLTARATRTITVNPQPPAPPPPTAPKITIIGSNPIILHQDSTTPYKEQSAKAIDGDGNDISNLVTVTGWTAANRTTAGTYTLTYSITSPTSGLKSTTTRNVRIVAPTEKRDPRVSYGFSGQAKAGAVVTHTGVVSSALGFMDLTVASIDKNMTISVQLIDTATNKAVLTDKFSAAGTKQYKIDAGKYNLAVTIVSANGNSKYGINLLMPEAAPVLFYETTEVPLLTLPTVAPIGSNPIILHQNGTPYYEQSAKAVDYLGNDISDQVVISGEVDTSVAGTYTITYTVTGPNGIPVSVTRDVEVIAPNEEGIFDTEEVPLAVLPGYMTYDVVRGDTLYGIAKKYLGTGSRWGEIYDQNKAVIGKDPRMLQIGMELLIKLDS